MPPFCRQLNPGVGWAASLEMTLQVDDLANSQVSPFEVTTPKILKKAGYQNALFGKFHLAGPDNNPFGRSTPHVLGWDYFDGFLEGGILHEVEEIMQTFR